MSALANTMEARLSVKNTFLDLGCGAAEDFGGHSPGLRRCRSDSQILSPVRDLQYVQFNINSDDEREAAFDSNSTKEVDTDSTHTGDCGESGSELSEGIDTHSAGDVSALARVRAKGRDVCGVLAFQAVVVEDSRNDGQESTEALRSDKRRSRCRKNRQTDSALRIATPAVPIQATGNGVFTQVANLACETGLTTLMFRNVPNSYTRDMIVDLLDAHGFHGHYDFVYLPVDFVRKGGLGFAFVNMVTAAMAETVMQTLQGFTHWTCLSSKVLSVSWSDPLQGLAAHLEHHRNSPLMHATVPDAFKPAVFAAGQRVELPAPTKRIRAPRVRPSRA